MELRGAATLFLAACISCLIFLWKRKQKQQTSKLPPGPTPLPLLGNVLQLSRTHLFKSLVTLGEKYGPVFTVYLGSRRVVVLCGHEAVKQALVDHGEVFGGRGRMPTLDRIFHGYGVIFANGERWKQLRQFSIMTLRNFGMGKRSLEERITEEAQCLVEEIRKTKGSPFDPSHPIGHAIASVLSAITFGQRFDYQDEKFAHIHALPFSTFRFPALSPTFPAQLYEMFPGIMQFLPGPHNRILKDVKVLHDFVTERVQMNQETLDPSCPRDYIDSFLIKMEEEKQNPQSEFHTKNLVLSAVHLFFGGTEMVSSTLRYGFLLLMKYTEIQGKVQEEIDHVIGKNRSPATEDRSQMPYTHAVIHEIQRFSNIIPLGIPHAVIQDTQFRGYTLPKGTDVFCLLGSALQDPQHFINPEDFDPRNFLDENGSFKKNNAFVAFSSGKRMCLGEGLARMELFLVFTSVLQHFTLKSPINPQEIDLTPKASGFWHVSPRYKLCAHPR
ncbi:cytochrome P450 2G1-like isoform X6 [Emydura macquarii macquarii]|uniref:cytochrome P450 2G1-like isoform X6 n=1 Tax=Emydura macquarii macquarii TaxID=1129001 RepID=UPI00352B37E0